ncbi:hypothetical protein X798_07917 [Onchocerca flexuosa]|uniref:RING-type domain-containing protein n=1 Tax=Onchocerca flexuosa TaxID=387005 RepID=A0A238BKP1_9BILA|nr:hypothetical protein X798_07917 [Onchocerca flexuosa]
MSHTIARSFDTTGVTMCTFNCDDNVADIIFIPCGHRVVCGICADGEVVEIGSKIVQHKECGDAGLDESVKMIDETQIEKIAQEAIERAKKAVEKEKNEEVRELRDKLEQLELEVTCAICMDQRCSIVFQCGHTTCVNCSNPSRLKMCHICRQPIKRRTTIYT